MTITNGTLINHHDNIPAGAKVTFKDVNIGIPEAVLKFRNKNSASSFEDFIQVATKVYSSSSTVSVGDDIVIHGQSSVHIINNSPLKHTYTIETLVCSMRQDICYSTSNSISLDSKGSVNLDTQPEATFRVATTAGNVDFYGVTTIVTKDTKGTVFSSFDNVMIDILDAKK